MPTVESGHASAIDWFGPPFRPQNSRWSHFRRYVAAWQPRRPIDLHLVRPSGECDCLRCRVFFSAFSAPFLFVFFWLSKPTGRTCTHGTLKSRPLPVPRRLMASYRHSDRFHPSLLQHDSSHSCCECLAEYTLLAHSSTLWQSQAQLKERPSLGTGVNHLRTCLQVAYRRQPTMGILHFHQFAAALAARTHAIISHCGSAPPRALRRHPLELRTFYPPLSSHCPGPYCCRTLAPSCSPTQPRLAPSLPSAIPLRICTSFHMTLRANFSQFLPTHDQHDQRWRAGLNKRPPRPDGAPCLRAGLKKCPP